MKNILINILKSLKNIVRLAAFVLVVALLLNIWIGWFKPKGFDGLHSMENFYNQPENSIDLLCVGSSHTFIDINTGLMWDKFGIPSYVLGASLQPFWHTYYNLREATKTQTPRLVVLEALAAHLTDDYSNRGVTINNVYGMHWNMNKLESIRAGVTDTDGLLDYGMLFEEYHNRYAELDMSDVASDLGDVVKNENFKGFYDYLRTEHIPRPEFDSDVDPIPMTNKQEYYYRMIIEFCQEEDIPLLIMVSPDGGYDNHARENYLYAGEIAAEYGVPFIDFNDYYDEIGLDFDEDFGDIGHLNHIGNRKFTTFFGNYIVSNFDLVDRRGDTTGIYDSWDENRKYLETRVENYLLQDTYDISDYYDMLFDLSDDYEVFVTISDITYVTDETRAYLGINGIPCSRPYDERRWMIRSGITTVLTSDDNGLYYEEFTGSHHLAVSSEGLYFDSHKRLDWERVGVEIVVFDRYNQLIADNVVMVGDEVWRLDF
ncbi:MAG: SGNH/GDSL hydrolase family protein [Clostridiales bacterium]|nr:SGNH/GDSL hydrolase family protein [Clostridiales bacterium]